MDELVQPKYENLYNLGKKYEPSYNVAPTDVTPVLISKAHLTEEKEDCADRVLVPMMWGIVPAWHKGEYTKHGFHTNNARLEGLQENKIFRRPFMAGQRCVVLCEGFYEWTTAKPGKTPYFIHAVQRDKETRIEDRSTWPKVEDLVLLKMAGIFDIWSNESGDQIWAYTVLTRESDDVLSWMHHRTPLFLETEEQIQDWLDFERVGPERALTLLKPIKLLAWHQVSTEVNNSRNKAQSCNKPEDGKDDLKTVNGRGSILKYFTKKPTRERDSPSNAPAKKPKVESAD